MSDKEVCPDCGKQKGATVSGSSKAWVFTAKCVCVRSKPTASSEEKEHETAKPVAENIDLSPIAASGAETQAPEGDAPPRASEVVTGDHEPISVEDRKSHEPKLSKSRKKNRNRRSKRSKADAKAPGVIVDPEPISVEESKTDLSKPELPKPEAPSAEPQVQSSVDIPNAPESAVITGEHEPISVEELKKEAVIAKAESASAEKVSSDSAQAAEISADSPSEVSSSTVITGDHEPISVEESKEEMAVEPPPVELIAEIQPDAVVEPVKNGKTGDAVLGALASEKMKPIIPEQGLDSGTWANAGESVKTLAQGAPRSFRDLPADILKTNSGDVGTSASGEKVPSEKTGPDPSVPSSLPSDDKIGTGSGGFNSSSVFTTNSGPPQNPPSSGAGFSSNSSVFSSSSSVFSANTSTFSTGGPNPAGGGTLPAKTDSFSTAKPEAPKSPTPGIGSFPSNKGTGSGVYTGTGIVFNDLKDFPPNPKAMPPTTGAQPGGGVPSGTGTFSAKAGSAGGVSSGSGGFSSTGSGGFSSSGSGGVSSSSGGFSSGNSSVSASNISSPANTGGFKKIGSASGANFASDDFGTSSTSGTSIMSTTSASGLLSDEMVSVDGIATAGGSTPEDEPENWVAVPKKSRDKAQSSFKHDSELYELIHPPSVKDGQDPVVTRNAILQTLRRRRIKTLITMVLAVAIAWVGYAYMSKQAEANKQAQSVSDPGKSSSPGKTRSSAPPNAQPKKKATPSRKQKRTH